LPETAAGSWGLQRRTRARQSLMTEEFYPSVMDPARRSRFELDLPVRAAQELVPGFAAIARRNLDERLPRRLLGRPAQLEARLRGAAIGLALVALDARQDAVFPGRHAAAAARDDVIDGELLRPGLEPTVLARVTVALEEVLARKDDGPSALPLVGREQDDLG